MTTSLTRRLALVAGTTLAAASAANVAAIAAVVKVAVPDPIFAAIERWKKALAAEDTAYAARSEAENAFHDRYGGYYPSALTRELKQICREAGIDPQHFPDTHEWIAKLRGETGEYKPVFHRVLNQQEADYAANVEPVIEASDRAGDVRIEAAYSVFKTVPTTLPGMRAKINWAFSIDHVTDLLLRNCDGDDVAKRFIETLYEAARVMAVR